MTEFESLEQRVKILEEECRRLSDIEAIRRLRYKYWRCIHKGLWDDLMDCYADEAAVDFGYGLKLEGKTALTDFYKGSMTSAFSLVDPQGHNPEIEVLSSTTARGFWQLDNTMVEAQTSKAVRVGASYDEEYVKLNGEWKISVQKVNHIYRQVVEMEGGS